MTAADSESGRATLQDEPEQAPAARAALYASLARAFDHPVEEWHAAAENGSLRAEFAELVDRSGLDLAVPRLDPEGDYESMAARYNGFFEVGYAEYTDRSDGSLDSEGPPVPLYETRYREASWDDVNTDLARAYDYFGLSVDEERRDHHDNLRLELEFAGYLARREALGDGDAARARRDFLERHLEPFTEGVLDRLSVVDEGVYPDIAELARRVVCSDAEALEQSLDGGGGNG